MSNTQTQDPSNTKTPQGTKPKGNGKARAKPIASKKVMTLMDDVRAYCKRKGIAHNELASAAEIPPSSARTIISGGGRYLKSETLKRLIAWFDAALALEKEQEPSGPYYEDPETPVTSEVIAPAQPDLFAYDNLPRDNAELREEVAKLRKEISDTARSVVSLQKDMLVVMRRQLDG